MKMNEKMMHVALMVKKDLAIWYYICVFILMISGLVFMLTSCMEEMIDKPGLPKISNASLKVAVHFSLGDLAYNGNEVVARTSPPAPLQKRGEEACFGGEHGEAETVVVPLEDDLNMVATLEVDQAVRLRTSTNLKPGTTLRIVAYENGVTYYDHADYTVTGSYSLDGVPLKVMPGDYKFVAYSYNSTDSLPEHKEALPDIEPDIDLLWGCTPESGGTHTIDVTNNAAIPITLKHAFSQMAIQVTTSAMSGIYFITAINHVTMPGNKAKLTVKDGITPKGEFEREFLSWTGIPSPTVKSDTQLVYTGGDKRTVVQIGTLVFNGNKKLTNLQASFDKQLKQGVSYILNVNFKKTGDIPIIDDTPPSDMLMYAGAFWRADQTGERLITIRRPASGLADGAWKATVLLGNDWIVLDKEMTTDKTVWTDNPQHSGNEKGFDEMYPVNSTLTTVSGNLNASEPQIYFRIGLRDKFQATSSVPARYGIVLLTYHDNTLKHRIWIRQGEGDDYLFSNADPVSAGNISTRTVTKRFSPFNLTADQLDATVDKPGDPTNNPGKFTDYPTKAGAFFQWDHVPSVPADNHTRWAWNPYIKKSSLWQIEQSVSSVFWDTQKAEHETCPPGYRRPNDGSVSGDENSKDISRSEMRQSLFQNPVTGFEYIQNWQNNVIRGYYADGFFDRRRITGNGSVAVETPDIAHIGYVFYNSIVGSDRYGASLFFPMAGLRYHSDQQVSVSNGEFRNPGIESGYWTSSVYDKEGIALRLWRPETRLSLITKNIGFSIRCVRDE